VAGAGQPGAELKSHDEIWCWWGFDEFLASRAIELEDVGGEGIGRVPEARQASQDRRRAKGSLFREGKVSSGLHWSARKLFRLIVQRVGDNPKILAAAMATTDARLTRLAAEGRLATDVEFARRSLMALSNGVTALWAQGASKTEIKAVGRFLLDATLSALLRAKRR
jgi:hypothetical protein